MHISMFSEITSLVLHFLSQSLINELQEVIELGTLVSRQYIPNIVKKIPYKHLNDGNHLLNMSLVTLKGGVRKIAINRAK